MSYSGKFKDKNNNLHPVTSVLYGTCDTAAGTAAKVVTCADFDTLMTGVTIRVKFDNANTAASPTVNINSTGAKSVYRFGSTAPVDGDSWKAGEVVDLLYDGTSFFMVSADDIGSKQDTLTFDSAPTSASTNPVTSGGVYAVLADKADNDIIAAEFDSTANYVVGNYCIYQGGLYKFKANHTGAWAAADVDAITIAGELTAKQPKTDNNLTTTSKDTTGAINELKSGLTEVNSNLTGLLDSITVKVVSSANRQIKITRTFVKQCFFVMSSNNYHPFFGVISDIYNETNKIIAVPSTTVTVSLTDDTYTFVLNEYYGDIMIISSRDFSIITEQPVSQ